MRDKYNEQRPTVPTIFVSTAHEDPDMNDVYVLYCKQMEWSIDCFVQTALVNMVATWKNQTDMIMNGVFMIPMRGKVTDCYVHIGSDRVRMVGLAERKSQSIPYNQPMVYKHTLFSTIAFLSLNIYCIDSGGGEGTRCGDHHQFQ